MVLHLAAPARCWRRCSFSCSAAIAVVLSFQVLTQSMLTWPSTYHELPSSQPWPMKILKKPALAETNFFVHPVAKKSNQNPSTNQLSSTSKNEVVSGTIWEQKRLTQLNPTSLNQLVTRWCISEVLPGSSADGLLLFGAAVFRLEAAPDRTQGGQSWWGWKVARGDRHGIPEVCQEKLRFPHGERGHWQKFRMDG